MLKKVLFPGKYIQGVGALAELPALIRLFGRQGLIVASPAAYRKILPDSGIDWSGHCLLVEQFAGECCENELSRLAAIIREKNVDVLVGMGGGKTIDTTKIAADRANIPVLVVPTIASTDAPCSGCAVLYSEQGVFESVYYQKYKSVACPCRYENYCPGSGPFSCGRQWAMPWRHGSRHSPAAAHSPKTHAADSAR